MTWAFSINVDFIQVPEFFRFDHGPVKMTMPHDPVAAEEKLATIIPGGNRRHQSLF